MLIQEAADSTWQSLLSKFKGMVWKGKGNNSKNKENEEAKEEQDQKESVKTKLDKDAVH